MEINENPEYKINYDGAWKQLITKQFKYFLEFFYDFVAQQVDWSKGFEFLDKELEKLFPEANESKKYADKLVKLFLKDGSEQWILVHLEIQNYKDETISERMFTYYYKILDLYKRDIVSLLLLTDIDNNWRPSFYLKDFMGTKLTFEYNSVKLIDYYTDDLKSEIIKTPFDFVILTHINAHANKEPMEKLEAKLKIVRVLVHASKILNLDKNLIRDMYIFLDWLLMLPKELNSKYNEELEKMKGEKGMEDLDMSISPTFRSSYEQGIEQGKEEGFFLAFANLVKQNLLSIQEAAKQLGMTEQAFYQKIEATK